MSVLSKIAMMAHGAGALVESEVGQFEAEIRALVREELVALGLIEAPQPAKEEPAVGEEGGPSDPNA